MAQVRQQVDHAGVGKAFDGHGAAEPIQRDARLGVERGEEEAGRDDVNHAAAVDLGVGHALAIVGAHGIFGPRRHRLAVSPDGVAGFGVDGHNIALVARNGVENAIDQRRRRTSADGVETGAVPFPDDFQLAEVLGGDFGRGGIAGVGIVAAEREPLVGVGAEQFTFRRVHRAGGEQRNRGQPFFQVNSMHELSSRIRLIFP